MIKNDIVKQNLTNLINQIDSLTSEDFEYLLYTDTFEEVYDAKIENVKQTLTTIGFNKNESITVIDSEQFSEIIIAASEIINQNNAKLNLKYYLDASYAILVNKEFTTLVTHIKEKIDKLDIELYNGNVKTLFILISNYFSRIKSFLDHYIFFNLELKTSKIKGWAKKHYSFELYLFCKVFIKIIDKEINTLTKIVDLAKLIGEKECEKIFTPQFYSSFKTDSEIPTYSKSKIIKVKDNVTELSFRNVYTQLYQKIKYNNFKHFDSYFKNLSIKEQQILIIIISLLRPIALFSIYSELYFQNIENIQIVLKGKKRKPEIKLEIMKMDLKKLIINYKKSEKWFKDETDFYKIFYSNPTPCEWKGNIQDLFAFLFVLLDNKIITVKLGEKVYEKTDKITFLITKIINSGLFFVKKNGTQYKNFSNELTVFKTDLAKNITVKNFNEYITEIKKAFASKTQNYYLELPNLEENYKNCSFILGKVLQ